MSRELRLHSLSHNNQDLPSSPDYSQRNERQEFRKGLKRLVRQEQRYRCAYCGKHCRGRHKNDPKLHIHHIQPAAESGSRSRDNAVGLCQDECHPLFDQLAHQEGKTFFDILMEEGKQYKVRSLGSNFK